MPVYLTVSVQPLFKNLPLERKSFKLHSIKKKKCLKFVENLLTFRYSY